MRDILKRILILIALLILIVTMSGCGALRKQPAAIPDTEQWVGPEGAVGDVRIILGEEPATIVLDLQAVDMLFDRTYLP